MEEQIGLIDLLGMKMETDIAVNKTNQDDAISSNCTIPETENEHDAEIKDNFEILKEYKNCYLAKCSEINKYSKKVKELKIQLAACKGYDDSYVSDGSSDDDLRIFSEIISKYNLDEELIEFYEKEMEDPTSTENRLQCLYDQFNKKQQ